MGSVDESRSFRRAAFDAPRTQDGLVRILGSAVFGALLSLLLLQSVDWRSIGVTALTSVCGWAWAALVEWRDQPKAQLKDAQKRLQKANAELRELRPGRSAAPPAAPLVADPR